MLIYIGAAIAVVLLALLYHYIPSRKIFFAFFFVLCAALQGSRERVILRFVKDVII